MSKPFNYDNWAKPSLPVRVKYNYGERKHMAADIADAMREAYEREGEEGDFEDAARYLRDDAGDAELDEEHSKWVNPSN